MKTRRRSALIRFVALVLAVGLVAATGTPAHAVTPPPIVGQATVTGHIKNPDGTAYTGGGSLGFYRFYQGSWQDIGGYGVQVNNDGSWVAQISMISTPEVIRVGLQSTGGYDAQFYSTSGIAWDVTTGTGVTLSNGGTVNGIDFTLAKNPGYGSIGGTMTDANGPIATSIKLYPDGATTTNIIALSDSATGAWSARVPAGTYRVSFSEYTGDGWATSWYGGTSLADATPVTVTGGGSTTGIGAQLVADPDIATIGGKVTGPDGAPLFGIDVWIYDVNDPTDKWAVFTDSDGNWSAPVKGGTSYRLGFAVNAATRFVPVFWPHASTLDAGQVITPVADTTTTTYDARLAFVPVSNTVAPRIVGRPVLGRTLTADPGTWLPGGVRFAYQWRADGVVIPRATNRTFVVTKAQLGKRLTVRVTGSKAEYASVSVTSPRTAIAKAQPRLRLLARAASSGRTRIAVIATAAVPVTGQVQLFDGRRLISSGRLVSGRRSVVVRLSRGVHLLRAHYLGSPRVQAATVRLRFKR